MFFLLLVVLDGQKTPFVYTNLTGWAVCNGSANPMFGPRMSAQLILWASLRCPKHERRSWRRFAFTLDSSTGGFMRSRYAWVLMASDLRTQKLVWRNAWTSSNVMSAVMRNSYQFAFSHEIQRPRGRGAELSSRASLLEAFVVEAKTSFFSSSSISLLLALFPRPHRQHRLQGGRFSVLLAAPRSGAHMLRSFQEARSVRPANGGTVRHADCE